MNTPLDDQLQRLRIGGALAAVAAVFLVLATVAWIGWGALAGGLFIGLFVLGAAAPPVAILGFREVVPNIVGVGLAVAAQVAFGQAGLVRRDDGQYEWGVLREDRGDYYVELERGDRVRIDADEGELYSFGFGKLAVAEQHTDAAVAQYTETDTPGDSSQPTDTRAGVNVAPPRRETGGLLVSLAKIQRVVRGSASSTLVRRGRDKALDEQGGTGQLSTLWTMAFATVLLLVGFGMTAGALMI